MFLISIPGKTFLLGEYVVLDGGPGLTLATPPCFTLQMHMNCDSAVATKPCFHPESPAGLWLSQHSDFFKSYTLDFFDPHQGKGGFGASGAEFIAVYAAQYPLEKTVWGMEKLLAAYLSVVQPVSGVLPSGADLVAQACNGITYWHRARQSLDQLTWSFPQLSYCLIRTGHKCVTRHALKKLPHQALTEMSQLVEEGYSAFKTADARALVNAVNEYAIWLKSADCVLDSTEELLQCLTDSGLIEAAKGCGALGADVILVLLAKEKLPIFLNWLEEHKLAPPTHHS